MWSAALFAADLIPGDVRVASRRRVVAELVAGRRVDRIAPVPPAAVAFADRVSRIAARRSFVRSMLQLLDDVQRRQVAGGMPPFPGQIVEKWKQRQRREWARSERAQRLAQGGAS
ncbi:MAG: hypothetical protein ACK52I_23540 [Pseudomonadota bacterium]